MNDTFETLPDYLRPELKIISVGLNPSIPSVLAGFPFANPRNRFWQALNLSGLVVAQLEPGRDAMQILLKRDSIGFTDVVKRPTAMGKDLSMKDYRRDAPLLKGKLLRYRPAWVWFHGMLAYRHYLKYAEGIAPEALPWGEQAEFCIGASRIFVSPNPSPANAAYSLNSLVGYYDSLAALTK
ncbi:MAG TPA: mismatch-specific DNA-glycosylase [Gammaproteobacteria bacterium]